jgi:hypothetical protein
MSQQAIASRMATFPRVVIVPNDLLDRLISSIVKKTEDQPGANYVWG